MYINQEKFEEIVTDALDSLPEKFSKKINNLAIFAEDRPTKEQLKKLKLRNNFVLYGLFEGYAQARKLNFGPVLPDKITIFRLPICQTAKNEEEIKEQIISTVKHEIAHHFGLDEAGARKASR
ncbi:MAG: metallopeptidase family protein, partial [Patescibacteria group bacterium]